ncbi:amino acid transporter -like protein [Halotydeus destructor]|nr:amino acid transporter -like protein [Halotydeus destructor]
MAPDDHFIETSQESDKHSDSKNERLVESVGLKRRVGLFSGTALIVGTMIGALCYAELGTLITKSGAEYSYIHEAFGGLLAFLFSWVSVFILKPAMLAIICLTLAEYVVSPFYVGCEPDLFLIKLITMFSIMTITYLNCHSVQLATGTQNVFTLAKLLAIVVIVVGGMVKIFNGETEHIATGFSGTKTSVADIATAFYSGLWAYDGWNNLNYVTEELINPYRNLPLAIIYGIPCVTLCYVLVNVSYMTVMSTDDLLSSDAVALTWGTRVLGAAAVIMPVSVAISSFGSGNGSCFTSGRLSFAAARNGHLIDVLSYVHIHKYTPSPALIFNAFIAILYVIPGNIESLIDFFSFTAWLFYGATMVSLVILRYKPPFNDMPRPYKVHLSIPVLVSIISVYLVVAPIIEKPQIEYLYATLYILSGALVYVPFVVCKVRFGFIGDDEMSNTNGERTSLFATIFAKPFTSKASADMTRQSSLNSSQPSGKHAYARPALERQDTPNGLFSSSGFREMKDNILSGISSRFEAALQNSSSVSSENKMPVARKAVKDRSVFGQPDVVVGKVVRTARLKKEMSRESLDTMDSGQSMTSSRASMSDFFVGDRQDKQGSVGIGSSLESSEAEESALDECVIKEYGRAESQASLRSADSVVSSEDSQVESNADREARMFMQMFVGNVFDVNADISLEEKAKFGEFSRTEAGRQWFARCINSERGQNKLVNEKTFYSLVQYFAIVLFECSEADHFTPAKTLMNMCFTFYYQSSSTNDKNYLYVYLKEQPIWKSLRFWTAAFYEAVQSERSKRPSSGRRLQQLSAEEVSDEAIFQENITFGQLGTFTYNLKEFGLPKQFCLDFLSKQSTIADLPDEQFSLLRENIERLYQCS